MTKQLLSPEDSAELNRHLQKTDHGISEKFIRLIRMSLELPGASLGFPKSECIVFMSPRYNFVECVVQKECVRFRLRRKADYDDPDGWLASEPKMPSYSLNQFFRVTADSNLSYAFHLIQRSYQNASGIDLPSVDRSNKEAFAAHLSETNVDGSGKASSYIKALELLEQMLNIEPYEFSDCSDIWSIQSVERLQQLRKWVLHEQRKGSKSPWVSGDIPVSYLRAGYCSAALSQLFEFIPQHQHTQKVLKLIKSHEGDADELSKKLNIEPDYPKCLVHDPNTQDGQDRIREQKTRVGQGTFREMILRNYSNRCCITGLDIRMVNRASHIIGWAEPKGKKIRMDQQNGLCLSATYDAAFDKHLISLDDDYRLILSKEIKEHYTSESVQTYFQSKEGDAITLPKSYLPKKNYLAHHRSKGDF